MGKSTIPCPSSISVLFMVLGNKCLPLVVCDGVTTFTGLCKELFPSFGPSMEFAQATRRG